MSKIAPPRLPMWLITWTLSKSNGRLKGVGPTWSGWYVHKRQSFEVWRRNGVGRRNRSQNLYLASHTFLTDCILFRRAVIYNLNLVPGLHGRHKKQPREQHKVQEFFASMGIRKIPSKFKLVSWTTKSGGLKESSGPKSTVTCWLINCLKPELITWPLTVLSCSAY